ncbi:FAD:protein FMN transferase [Sinomonas sp. ASV322]|uniref:FAD:protein FMN transferase n=1 Tax=Sinomonas sp. ASV322 TaxID=3041920 RepID=UPI0027DC6DB0|nr:FAD:protein FMN transferase [Sinomonas sp. ASV322]MDQ4502036.1 FAD:protein FMN transferase [Sinomonas sp. ASV322]
MESFTFEAIGTLFEVRTDEPLGDALEWALLREVERFDWVWSRFRPDSIVAQMRAGSGRWDLPSESSRLAELYARLYRVTRGAVNPWVGSSLERIGYGPGYELVPSGAPEPAPLWDDDHQWEGTAVVLSRPGVLDIGAAGKGLLVDLLGSILAEAGHPAFVVDGSGDILHAGLAPLRVGLEHPYHADQAIGVVELDGAALCASSGNRRAWGDGFHHLLDARTGAPVRSIVATWATAQDAMTADALATALFVAPGEDLAAEFATESSVPEWLQVFADGHAEGTPFFMGGLFS